MLTFDKMISKRKECNCNWKTGEDVFCWWMEEDNKNVKGQLRFDLEDFK